MGFVASESGRSARVALSEMDWESLGRFVRQQTLEAVGQHFMEQWRESGRASKEAPELHLIRELRSQSVDLWDDESNE